MEFIDYNYKSQPIHSSYKAESDKNSTQPQDKVADLAAKISKRNLITSSCRWNAKVVRTTRINQIASSIVTPQRLSSTQCEGARSASLCLRTAALSILNSGGSFSEMSLKMQALVKKAAPQSFAQLNALKEQHSELLKILKEKGWTSLKRELKEKMASHDSTRVACVDGVVNLLMETLKAMGFDPPGNHAATGTPGWNSDIDTPYFAPKGMPHQIQVLEKIMFDMVMYAEFGQLPGFFFDTESYTQQAGALHQTQNSLETAEGASLFAHSELTACLMQKLVQTGGPSTEEWTRFKATELAAAQKYGNDDYQKCLKMTFTDLESLHQDIQKGINASLRHHGPFVDSKTIKLVMMGYKTRGLIGIAKEIDKAKKELQQLEKENSAEKGKQRDLLRIRMAQLEVLLNSFYDEGYLTQGAFRKVCFLNEGQVHQRKVELQREMIRKHYQTQLNRQAPPSKIASWTEGFKLGKMQQTKSVAQENFSSMMENLAMYFGHFKHEVGEGQNDAAFRSALLHCSKYSDRVIQSALELLKNVKNQDSLTPQHKTKIVQLENQMKELSFKIAEQEKVKRAHILNYASTELELWRALKVNGDEDKMNALKIVLEASEPTGGVGKAKFDESILPEDRYLVLFSKMVSQGLIQEKGADQKGLPCSDHSEVDLILKARCGFTPSQDPELYRQLVPYHQRSPQTTLEAQNLMLSDEISKFNEELKQVVSDTSNLSLFYKVVPNPSTELKEELSLTHAWSKAIHTAFKE